MTRSILCSYCKGTGIRTSACELAGLDDGRCCRCPEGDLLFDSISAIISRNCLAGIGPHPLRHSNTKRDDGAGGAMISAGNRGGNPGGGVQTGSAPARGETEASQKGVPQSIGPPS